MTFYESKLMPRSQTEQTELQTKHCVDCKHHRSYKVIPFIGPTVHMCALPVKTHIDRVTGKTTSEYEFCKERRRYVHFHDKCGYTGELWEPK